MTSIISFKRVPLSYACRFYVETIEIFQTCYAPYNLSKLVNERDEEKENNCKSTFFV